LGQVAVRQIDQCVCLDDCEPLRTVCYLDDLVSSLDLTFLQNPHVKAGPMVRYKQCGHLRLTQPDADPIASDPRLCHLEYGTSDSISIADANLVIGQSGNGEVFSELTVNEVGAIELALPVTIGFDLVDEHRPLLTAMPDPVPLLVSFYVETMHPAFTGNRTFPHRGMYRLAVPSDVSREAYVYGKQLRHR
jgi:hypothetical protein